MLNNMIQNITKHHTFLNNSFVLKLSWLFKYVPVVFSGCAYFKVNPWKGPQMFPTKLWHINTVIFSKVFDPASMTLDFLPTLIQSNPPKTKNCKSSKMFITSTTLSNHPDVSDVHQHKNPVFSFSKHSWKYWKSAQILNMSKKAFIIHWMSFCPKAAFKSLLLYTLTVLSDNSLNPWQS